MFKKTLWTAFAALFCLILVAHAQTPPDEFLGHKVGADRKLADFKQITAYFQKLDSESERMQLLEIGKSTEGNNIIMAVITSEENMAKLDRYREITRSLRDARGLTPEDAKALAMEGKSILLITCSLHASEIAASQMSMEFAYNLVTGKTPFDADKALSEVIVLLVPSHNPDGNIMVADWYRKTLGTEHEGSSMPWLYQKYSGHDNHRDWFMFNLSETQAVTKVLYHDWIPQIHIDEHQMGSTGARLFVPPFMDPPVPTVHPLLWRGVALCGMNMAYDLQKNGFSGVTHGRSYTGWWIGACDDTSWLHNCIGLLSEMASVQTASPVYIDPSEVSASYIDKRMQFPDPWPGGWWRLRDLVDYELTLSMSLVETAWLHKEDLLYNFYQMCSDAIEKPGKGQPFAFVIPKDQRDYPTAMRFLKVIQFGGVEIHQAKEEFVADGKVYPAGSFVVMMAQPYRPFAQALLEKQEYPDLRQYPGGPPVPPYDNAGWTLPLQMGVTCDQIDRPFKAELEKLEGPLRKILSNPIPETAKYVVLDSKKNAAYSVVFGLMKHKPVVYRSQAGINGDGFHACVGSFIIENSPKIQQELTGLLEKWNLQGYPLDDISEIKKSPLKRHRVALYQSWRSNMDEGWTRYVLDDLQIPFTSLHNQDFKGEKKKKVDLRSKFDVIVFADESPEVIKTGQRAPGSGRYRGSPTPRPAEYEGGIDKEGVEALKDFVAKGGILVTMNSASGLVFTEFKGAPVSNALANVSRTDFFCPTSLLNIEVDNHSPIGYGMPKNAAAMFSRSLAYSTRVPSTGWGRTVVARYPVKDVLASGWLLGENRIARRAAVVDVKYKEGHIVLIGFRCQHRAQSHGTYKFLLNALLYPDID